MEYTCFEVSIEENIAQIRFNRPEKRNSMNAEFWQELPHAIRDIDTTAEARVIVISSTGPHFTAGLDLSVFANNDAFSSDDDRQARVQHGSRFLATVKPMQDTFSAVEECRIPVLAAIQGGCIGGGEGIVRELAYTGRKMPAGEAQECGLVNRVYANQEEMLASVMEIAREIATKSPHAVYGCKRMITYARDHSTADALDYVAVWNMSMLSHEEIMEGVSANMQKRAGDFIDLPPLKKPG